MTSKEVRIMILSLEEILDLKEENVFKIEIEHNTFWVYTQKEDTPTTHHLQGKTFIKLYRNYLRKVPSLRECVQITTLNVENNLIKRLSHLPPFLTEFYCGHNCLGELPLLPDTLRVLHCGDNLFEKLEIVSPNLVSLSCSNGRLRSLIVKAKTLERVWCQSNNLTTLIIESEKCSWLKCSRNRLTNLSLPDNLKTLICSANELKSISRLPNSLITLNLNNNPLLFVPFSAKRPQFVIIDGFPSRFHSKENYETNYRIQNMIRVCAMIVFEECGLINDFLRDELFGLFVG